MNIPCYNCPERRERCHSSCEKYVKFAKACERRRYDSLTRMLTKYDSIATRGRIVAAGDRARRNANGN